MSDGPNKITEIRKCGEDVAKGQIYQTGFSEYMILRQRHAEYLLADLRRGCFRFAGPKTKDEIIEWLKFEQAKRVTELKIISQ